MMDYAGRGDLFGIFQKRGNLSENEAKYIIGQIVIGLDKLHQRNIIYRDLKQENVFLDINGNVLLGDFGLSCKLRFKHERRTSIAGSPDYMSPEMLGQSGYGLLVDYYSLGVLLYELLVGQPPFYMKSGKERFVLSQKTQINFPKQISQSCRNLISGLLNSDPQKRIGAQSGVVEVIEHPWFSGVDFDFIRKGKRSPLS